ncbi:hypothetical protein GYMLUDRAFT_240187 [Collybiopsis luxurians FD-317 M1]|nr:hypothetical protein GYMLUDRAFT_240187 [Collybiopsis luxurians FD-317 M1]
MSSRELWIFLSVIVVGISLHRMSPRMCFTISKLNATITTVDQELRGYENERAAESPFSSVECTEHRARFNRRRLFTGYYLILSTDISLDNTGSEHKFCASLAIPQAFLGRKLSPYSASSNVFNPSGPAIKMSVLCGMKCSVQRPYAWQHVM